MRHNKLLILVLLWATLTTAQMTSVTATVVDPAAQPYANGVWTIQFHPNGFDPTFYKLNGASFTQQYAGSFDNTGLLTESLPDNSVITPSGSTWDFTVCPNASMPCTTISIPVSGVSEDVSTQINTVIAAISIKLDPQPNARPLTRAYTDAEIANPVQAAMYYNVTDSCIHKYDGTTWTTICGTGVTPVFTCPGAINGSGAFFTSPSLLGCDNLVLTDFLGHLTSQSWTGVGPLNGEMALTTIGITPLTALPANTLSIIPPNVIPTPYRTNWMPGPCTDGQVIQQLSHAVDGTGTMNIFLNCLTPGGGGGGSITLDTNGVANASQVLLNLINSAATNGITLTVTNTSGGIVQLGFTGTLNNSGLTNSSVTYNGQTVALGAAGNVNVGAATHSIALNQGNGNAVTGLAAGAHQVVVGVAGADPVAKTMPDCQDTAGNHLNFTQSTDTFNCGTSGYVLPGQYTKLRCETGLGDGLNAMTAGTYLQSFCYNDSGVTWNITGLRCFTDNNGTSTMAATNGAGTALLTGAVTCTTAFAAGTQSATTTIANGDFIKFTFVADATSKQTTWVVSMTQ